MKWKAAVKLTVDGEFVELVDYSYKGFDEDSLPAFHGRKSDFDDHYWWFVVYDDGEPT